MSGSGRFHRASPESQGISSAAILDLVGRFEREVHDVHSFMLLRHGVVVAEGWWRPYGADLPHLLFSLTKSFTSTAVGMAVAEGLLSTDDPVVSFFPDDLPDPVPDNLAAMKVRHLLTMTTGHETDSNGPVQAAPDGNWPRAFLAHPVEHTPGTHFLYDTGGSHMLSAIVQRVTGQKLVDYLRPRLFDPLGIGETWWEEDPRGRNTGGFGLSLRTEEIAAFGQLYLQRGVWQGRRLIDEAWVAQATRKQVENGTDPKSDWAQGYGFQFWRCRHDGYRGDGAFGQYCIVMPDLDVVLAMTSGLPDMQVPLDIVWETLLPGIADAPLPEDRATAERLAERLADLAYGPPQGAAWGEAATAANGRTFALEPNPLGIETIRFDFSDGGCTLSATDGRGAHTLAFGCGDWQVSDSDLFEVPTEFASGGAWTSNTEWSGVARARLTPFLSTISARFDGDGVEVTMERNVDFEPIRPLTLRGAVS